MESSVAIHAAESGGLQDVVVEAFPIGFVYIHGDDGIFESATRGIEASNTIKQTLSIHKTLCVVQEMVYFGIHCDLASAELHARNSCLVSSDNHMSSQACNR